MLHLKQIKSIKGVNRGHQQTGRIPVLTFFADWLQGIVAFGIFQIPIPGMPTGIDNDIALQLFGCIAQMLCW
jgi:hypothetical protein